MANPQNNKVAGGLFILAGMFFFVAALMGKQVSFYGVGAMFVMLGVAYLIRSKGAG